jgi:hypothetical protein
MLVLTGHEAGTTPACSGQRGVNGHQQITWPLTEACTIKVTFTPTNVGGQSGALTGPRVVQKTPEKKKKHRIVSSARQLRTSEAKWSPHL